VAPVSPSRPGTVSERPRVAGKTGGSGISRPAAIRTSTPDAPLAPLEPLPYATHEIPGRASLPLAAANPEVRRSKTELFDRSGRDPLADGPPARPRASNNLALFDGVAVVLAAGALVFYLKQKPAPSPPAAGTATMGASVTPGTPAPRPAIPAAGNGAPGGADPKTNSQAAAAGGPSAVPAAEGAAAHAAGADAKPEGKLDAGRLEGNKKSGGSRRHRSSREAVESLHEQEGGSAEPTRPGVRTPAELKNPFQQQP